MKRRGWRSKISRSRYTYRQGVVPVGKREPDDQEQERDLRVASFQELEREQDGKPAEGISKQIDGGTHVPRGVARATHFGSDSR